MNCYVCASDNWTTIYVDGECECNQQEQHINYCTEEEDCEYC